MGDKTRMDGQKLDMHPARLAAWLAARDDWDKAKDIFPIYTEISPVGVCNHQCTFCSVDYMLDRKDAPRLDYSVMTRTLTDMATHGVLAAMFAGCGEPLIYRGKDGHDLADVILHADSVGLDTAVTTNSVLLTDKVCEKAFQAKRLRWIRTSVNAGDRETYARIHRTKPIDFDAVIRNLEQAVKIRERLGSKVILFGQIVVVPEASGRSRGSVGLERYPSNIHTVIPLAKALRDIGVDNLGVKPFKQHTVELERTRSKMYQAMDYSGNADWDQLFDELKALETPNFEVTIRRQAMSQQVATDRGYAACLSTPFHWTYIEADGEVWGCSAHVGRVEHGQEIGNHRFRFGSVNEQSFSEIWRGERRRACWEYTRRGPCDGGLDVNKCMRGCQMDMPNVFLWDLTHPDSTVNFIK